MFRIETTFSRNGNVVSIPVITMDGSEEIALARFLAQIDTIERDLNTPLCDGEAEIVLLRCYGLFDGGDECGFAKLKRPLKSKAAQLWVRWPGKNIERVK